MLSTLLKPVIKWKRITFSSGVPVTLKVQGQGKRVSLGLEDLPWEASWAPLSTISGQFLHPCKLIVVPFPYKVLRTSLNTNVQSKCIISKYSINKPYLKSFNARSCVISLNNDSLSDAKTFKSFLRISKAFTSSCLINSRVRKIIIMPHKGANKNGKLMKNHKHTYPMPQGTSASVFQRKFFLSSYWLSNWWKPKGNVVPHQIDPCASSPQNMVCWRKLQTLFRAYPETKEMIIKQRLGGKYDSKYEKKSWKRITCERFLYISFHAEIVGSRRWVLSSGVSMPLVLPVSVFPISTWTKINNINIINRTQTKRIFFFFFFGARTEIWFN